MEKFNIKALQLIHRDLKNAVLFIQKENYAKTQKRIEEETQLVINKLTSDPMEPVETVKQVAEVLKEAGFHVEYYPEDCTYLVSVL